MSRKYSLDENYFSLIDSEEKAYFLGFLFADGSVEKYQVCLCLAERDKEILEKLKENINYSGPLLFLNRANYNCSNQWRLLISRKKIIKDLISLGCVPKKSNNIIFPEESKLSSSLKRHFIRGYFDGDGWSYLNKKTRDSKAGIVSASRKFLESIKKITKEEGIESSIKEYDTYSVLTYSGNNNSYKFLHWIYDDSKIFLKRKREKFMKSEKEVNKKVKRQPHRRSVIQHDLQGSVIKEFESAVHAERELNIKYQNIRVCCDNQHKTAGGFRWSWK